MKVVYNQTNWTTTNAYGYADGYNSNFGNYSMNSFQGVIKCNGTTDVDVNAYNNQCILLKYLTGQVSYYK